MKTAYEAGQVSAPCSVGEEEWGGEGVNKQMIMHTQIL